MDCERKQVVEWIREVHQNAVEHGWWEADRDMDETFALIHSEWSEALEEDRAGRPMEWYACSFADDTNCKDNKDGICYYQATAARDVCDNRNDKPEGIAVELIDGVIRIFDFLGDYMSPGALRGNLGCNGIDDITDCEKSIFAIEELLENVASFTVPQLVQKLHYMTDIARYSDHPNAMLFRCCSYAFAFIKSKGIDPEEILYKKHEYNKHRPYKHGKKY